MAFWCFPVKHTSAAMDSTPQLADWIGRSETREDWINPNQVAAWHATLDRDDAFPRAGEALSPGFHWTLFAPLARQSQIGADGHALRGGFLPPVALPRRMWAGGRLHLHQPLRVGDQVTRRSQIERVEAKQGKAGQLVFVTVRHTLSTAAGVAIEEEQDIVYRQAPQAGAVATSALAPVAARGPWQRQMLADAVLLFRYSALTFNGHRIHYDRDYATGVEGYPGLVVHGPLLATLLLDLLRRQGLAERLQKFTFRALRPTFDNALFTVDGGPGDAPGHFRLWTTDNQGAAAMEAEAWLR